MAQYRIALAGGGSGGHIFPLITIAGKLREKLGGDVELLYIGGPKGMMEREAFGAAGIPIKWIAYGKWRRYFSFLNFLDIFRMPFGIIQSLWHLLVFMPDAILSKGGGPAVPVVLAAWIYRIPILTHESDAMPGVANRIIGKFADRIAVGYPSAKDFFAAAKTVVTGNPVRPELFHGDIARARRQYGLSGAKPVLVVFGGSQGAKSLNSAVCGIAPSLLEHFDIIHQTGAGKDEEVLSLLAEYGVKPGEKNYAVVPFLDTEGMGDVLAVADIVISRAGVSQIMEIAAIGRAALILIPHGAGSNGHQRMNAYDVARSGGAVVLDEPNLGENLLLHKTIRLWYDEPGRKKMAAALHGWYRADSADVIALGVIGLLKK